MEAAETLSPDERTYLAQLIAGERYAAAARQSFVNYLAFKHKLADGDQIGDDGAIQRLPSPPDVRDEPAPDDAKPKDDRTYAQRMMRDY